MISTTPVRRSYRSRRSARTSISSSIWSARDRGPSSWLRDASASTEHGIRRWLITRWCRRRHRGDRAPARRQRSRAAPKTCGAGTALVGRFFRRQRRRLTRRSRPSSIRASTGMSTSCGYAARLRQSCAICFQGLFRGSRAFKRRNGDDVIAAGGRRSAAAGRITCDSIAGMTDRYALAGTSAAF